MKRWMMIVALLLCGCEKPQSVRKVEWQCDGLLGGGSYCWAK